MYELTPMGWFLAVLAAVCIGMAKAGFGGLGMLAILVMARVLPRGNRRGRFFRCLFLRLSFPLASTISTPAEAWF
jgi:ABC-type transport system involved in cytochrome c biogenesis permease subunit